MKIIFLKNNYFLPLLILSCALSPVLKSTESTNQPHTQENLNFFSRFIRGWGREPQNGSGDFFGLKDTGKHLSSSLLYSSFLLAHAHVDATKAIADKIDINLKSEHIQSAAEKLSKTFVEQVSVKIDSENFIPVAKNLEIASINFEKTSKNINRMAGQLTNPKKLKLGAFLGAGLCGAGYSFSILNALGKKYIDNSERVFSPTDCTIAALSGALLAASVGTLYFIDRLAGYKNTNLK